MRRILPTLAVVLACAACTVPIFDPSMSLAARTLDRIPTYRETAYLSFREGFDIEKIDFTFLPERNMGTLVMGQGFVIVTQDEVNNHVFYEWYDSGVQWTSSGWDYSTDDPMLPRWTASLKDGTTLGAISLDSGSGQGTLLTVDTTLKQINESSTDLASIIDTNLGLANPPQVVGASINATNNPAADELRVLVRYDTSFSEAWAQVKSTGIVLPYKEAFGTLKEYALGFLGTPRHLRYFHDPVNRYSFAQSYDAGSWTTWVWWDTVGGHAKLDAITHRIDALISQSAGSTFLFSVEDQMGMVYQYDGSAATLVAEFALGSLRFIGEAYIDGVWRMLFSRCLIDTKNKKIKFEIRAIDTANLVPTFGA